MNKSNSGYSKVNEIEFPFDLSNNKVYAKQNGIKGIKLLKYWLSILFANLKC